MCTFLKFYYIYNIVQTKDLILKTQKYPLAKNAEGKTVYVRPKVVRPLFEPSE